MKNLKSRWLIPAALATAVLAGCGSSDGIGGGGPTPPPTNPATSAQGVVDFLLALIANETSDLSEPKSTDGITFATDDAAEPSAI